jgi:hypothetical protein
MAVMKGTTVGQGKRERDGEGGPGGAPALLFVRDLGRTGNGHQPKPRPNPAAWRTPGASEYLQMSV